ncbi:Heat shock protein [Yarrowia sp. B02]|nr:Heat shock protein [Yarrowia sp. B02]
MSQAGRKDFTDKLSEGLQPDSTKSTGEKLSEKATDAYDKVASAVEPNSQKSATQKAGDTLESDASKAKSDISSETSKLQKEGESYIDQAKDFINSGKPQEYVEEAKKSINNFLGGDSGSSATGTK